MHETKFKSNDERVNEAIVTITSLSRKDELTIAKLIDCLAVIHNAADVPVKVKGVSTYCVSISAVKKTVVVKNEGTDEFVVEQEIVLTI